MNIFSEDTLNNVQEAIKINGSGHQVKEEASHPNEPAHRLQSVMEEMEKMPEDATKEMLRDWIQQIMSFYGSGLERILEVISKGNSNASREIYNMLIEDRFIASLLLIHDLHPLDLKTRLHQALAQVKPYMDSHGGSVEILSVDNGVAKLRLSGSCKGCPSSSSTLELGIKQAIEELCPDLAGLEVEGVADPNDPFTENTTLKFDRCVIE